VGPALGSTDLRETKAETMECLHSYLPRLAPTHGAARRPGPNLAAAQGGLFGAGPSAMRFRVGHRDGHAPGADPIERTIRQAAVWAVINGIHTGMGPLPEFRQAQKRVSGRDVGAHKAPTYELGTDPVRSRAKAKQMA
jgi:hypothetical protein